MLLNKASETPSSQSVSSGATSLPLDILRDAPKRLGAAALVYAATYSLAYFGPYFANPAVRQEGYWTSPQSFAAYVSISLALVLYVLVRRAAHHPQLLLDIGLIFEVVGAFGISMAQFWDVYPEWSPLYLESYLGIPWECVWIIIFPLIAPNTPGKVLLASVAAASTAPLVFILSYTFGATSAATPLAVILPYFLFTTYVCAGIAFFVSREIQRYGRRLKKAREIGSYELVEQLGAGGMGEVWKARHRMLARPSAIKLIRGELLGADLASRSGVSKRFQREAKATASLRSCHTIDIYDFGVTEEGAFYYVMELLDGLSLETLVKRYGPISAERAVYLLRQVCHSLEEAHGCMIHRDIKPANIFTCHLGPDHDFVKVLDFGLVKTTMGLEGMQTQLTGEGVAAGTPAYMAPETALEKEVDGRADLYAVGCVAYWLLTGDHVFHGKSPVSTILEHVRSTPVPPSQRTEIPIPDRLEQVILACLEKDPADRPQTAAQLADLFAESVDTQAWDGARAREWWRLHQPGSTEESPTSADEFVKEIVRVER